MGNFDFNLNYEINTIVTKQISIEAPSEKEAIEKIRNIVKDAKFDMGKVEAHEEITHCSQPLPNGYDDAISNVWLESKQTMYISQIKRF